MKRTPLRERLLPNYSRGEELMNMITHIVGGALGLAVLLSCVIKAALRDNFFGILSCTIYGTTFITMFTISSVYHGMRTGIGKKVLQVIDHCTIYFLIAGTYTPVALSALRPVYPVLGWGMFAFQWTMAALAVTLTAIDLKKYNVFSMICYIGMGWAVLPFMEQTYAVLSRMGFWLLLWGGISYTVGAVLYGIGSKKPWLHSVFHIFVVLGSLLQFLCIFFYVL